MFRSLLIANRGEIACRIIGTARRLGIETIAVYSDADATARHVRLADRAVRLGPAAARESYLSVEKILAAAKATGAEAIHPGYGFLSENAELADACAAQGIAFVGPSADAIRAMGSKSVAKSLMEKFDVPLTPGYHGNEQEPAKLAAEAERIGYPVLIKASAGGGGKGMRRVDTAADFAAALASCKREAQSSFNSDHVLVERYIERPRHIEVQIFGDKHGNYVYLFERDCSVQRRHQKVLEEAPAPGMTEERRAAMGRSAVRAAQAVGYAGAGTVEFISDPAGTFYFMEMNTRLQVEHPVTEKITGEDLVEWQLRVAAGEVLPRRQEELSIRGHAIEARIYAENPSAGFLPSTGRLVHLAPPATSEYVRIDSGVEQGDAITPHYDPMIAKLIVWGEDRHDALARIGTALDHYEIVGVANNVEFLARLVRTPSFVNANLDTGLIERERSVLLPEPVAPSDHVWLVGAAAELAQRESRATRDVGSPWAAIDGWRSGGAAPQLLTLRHESDVREVFATFLRPGEYAVALGSVGAPSTRLHFEALPEGHLRVTLDETSLRATAVVEGSHLHLFVQGHRWDLDVVDPLYVESDGDTDVGGLRAPMPGKVIAHIAGVGASVEKGAPLLVLEAMKMELTISAPRAGVVQRFLYEVGEQVSEGVELVAFEEKTS
ncbi:MAG: Methylcrotonyl-CoA carboxylase biotin-containing subunit [Labilithrix sp.]|nr:Methylcrotonyl-CoA carboxylase biotin-containing subunit [Labilithrix sp.]